MEIYKLIESKAMREHLKDYPFTALEASYIIRISDLSFHQRHEAWQYVIDNMPDCLTPEGQSVHQFLKECIEESVNLFVDITDKNNKYIYTFERNCAHDKYYDDFSLCFKDAVEESISTKTRTFVIYAHKKNTDGYCSLCFSVGGELQHISALHSAIKTKEAQIDSWNLAFPHPFKTGDILCCNNLTYRPFVVAPPVERSQEFEDIVLEDSIGVYEMYNRVELQWIKTIYMDYYDGTFNGNDRIIKMISEYLINGSGLCELLNAYHARCAERDLDAECYLDNF